MEQPTFPLRGFDMGRFLKAICLVFGLAMPLFFATPAKATLLFTAACNANNLGASSIACTLPVLVVSGDALIVCAIGGGGSGAATITITASPSSTYTDSGLGLFSASNIGATVSIRCGAFLAPATGSTSITATFPGAQGVQEIYAWKVSGFIGTPTIDKAVTALGTGTTLDSGSSGTLTAAVEAAVGYGVTENAAISAGSGWTIGGTNINDGISGFGDIGEHQITSSTAAINATAAQNSGGYSATLVTIYDNSGPPPPSGGTRRSLTGVGN